MKIATVNIFGFDFISATMADLCAVLTDELHVATPLVITPNVEHVVKYDEMRRANPALYQSIIQRAVVLPDGQPIVWASRLLGTPLLGRLAGSDLFPEALHRLVAAGKRIYLIGPDEEVLAGVLAKAGSPQLFRTYAPPFFSPEARGEVMARMIRDVRDFQPEAVFVGLGFPKQEIVSLEMAEAMAQAGVPVPRFYCIGASLEFYAGAKRRAPMFLRRIGMEWAFRLAQEPQRLWKRYLLSIPSFLRLCLAEKGRRKARRPE